MYAAPPAAGLQFFATDLATAELAKAAANSFLATKISFINPMPEVCGAAGADVGVLARILGADPRIGGALRAPGSRRPPGLLCSVCPADLISHQDGGFTAATQSQFRWLPQAADWAS